MVCCTLYARSYAPGTFHGYLVNVADREDSASKRTMREVSMTARDSVTPYRLYGVRYVDDPAGDFRMGRISYSRNGGGCMWSKSGAPQGIEQCTAEQITKYSEMLEHAIEDVVR